MFSKTEVINDGGVKKLVNEQMTQWSEMVERHRREKWALQKQQATEQQDALVKLMENVQATQMKQLEVRHEKYDSCGFLNIDLNFLEMNRLQGFERDEYKTGKNISGSNERSDE